MGKLTVVYWRDIPSQVTVQVGRTKARRPLHQRFQDGIDQAAMVSGAHDSDAYMDAWRRVGPAPCGDDADGEADAAAARLEEEFGVERLRAIVRAGGHDPG